MDPVISGSHTQEIANSLHGCVQLRHRLPPELVVTLLQRLTDYLQQAQAAYEAKGLSSALLSCLYQACSPPSNVLRVLLQCLSASDVDLQARANTVYAVCGLLFVQQDHATLQQCLPQLRTLATVDSLEDMEHARQLLQAHQACAAMGVDQLLPAALLNKCQQLIKQHNVDTRPSRLQEQVTSVLKGLHMIKAVHVEVPVLMETSQVDVVCTTHHGAQVVVEVDGPTHFFANATRTPNGSTMLKHALLRHQGYALVLVHYMDWIACNTPESQHALLLQLLESASGRL
jgi:very-short-patch-repair endonuclease